MKIGNEEYNIGDKVKFRGNSKIYGIITDFTYNYKVVLELYDIKSDKLIESRSTHSHIALTGNMYMDEPFVCEQYEDWED